LNCDGRNKKLGGSDELSVRRNPDEWAAGCDVVHNWLDSIPRKAIMAGRLSGWELSRCRNDVLRSSG